MNKFQEIRKSRFLNRTGKLLSEQHRFGSTGSGDRADFLPQARRACLTGERNPLEVLRFDVLNE